MPMKSEEQLPESLLMLRTLLLRQAGARAMPPMSEVGRALCAESDGYCIDEHDHGPSLSLFESTHLRQGSGLAASLVPRSSLQGHDGRTATRASSSQDA
jgi:hypothetical protein